MQDLCEACMFSDYDEEYEEYTCAALWEEDVAARYLEGQYRQCRGSLLQEGPSTVFCASKQGHITNSGFL